MTFINYQGICMFEMTAVFDRMRVDQVTINAVASPYDIWNNQNLKGRSTTDPAYILAEGAQGTSQRELFETRVVELKKDPRYVVKMVYCGN